MTPRQICQFRKTDTKNDADIYYLLESVNWIWRGFGILSVVPKGPIGNRKYSSRKALVIYNILLSILFVCSHIGKRYNSRRKQILRHYSVDVQLLITVRQQLNVISVFDVVFWQILVKNKFIEAVDLLAQQDNILRKLGCVFNYVILSKKYKIVILFHLSVLLLISGQIVLFGISIYTMMDWVTWWYPNIIHKLKICLFLTLVWLLGLQFKVLNNKLESVLQGATSQGTLDKNESVNVFRKLANVHANLCKIGKSFNCIFIFTLIIISLEAVVFTTLAVYSLIIELQNEQILFRLSSGIIVIITSTCSILTTVMICNWTRGKANGAEKIINNIRVHNEENIPFDLIEHFSLQMHHQKLLFSVGGLFTLDSAFLQAITATLAMYLTILIQFGQLENILSNKS